MNVNRFYKSAIFKWVFLIVLLLCVTVISVSIFLFNWYENNNIEMYSDMTRIALLNTSQMIEALDSSLKSTGFLATRDNDVARMLWNTSYDSWSHVELQVKLNNLRLIHDVVYSLYLVNERADWIVGFPLPGGLRAVDYSATIKEMITGDDAIVRIDTHTDPFGMDVLSYVFFLTRAPLEDDSFLIINIRQQEFTDLLEPMETIEGVLTVVNSAGTVIFSHNKDYMHKEFGDRSLIDQIKTGGSEGSFLSGRGSERALVTYVSCERTRFTYITETPFREVRSAANALRIRTIILSAVILLCGIIAAIILARHFYKPLRRLVEKYILNDPQRKDWISSKYKNEYELIEKIFDEIYNRTVSIDSFVSDVNRAIKEQKNTNENIENILDFIRKEYTNPDMSLDFVADYVDLNPSYLGKIFFDNTGVRFPEYISRLRIDAAKELLSTTEESVNHIARLVGFNSTTYFITSFKKYTGVTPAMYR